MSTKSLMRPFASPVLFDDFFKPWNEWFDKNLELGTMTTIPPVNITENKDHYMVSLAAPGYKKDDFEIDLHGNLLTIRSVKKEEKEEKEEKFTRKEYNYASFSRSFTLPEEIMQDSIEAKYEDGMLNIKLPLKEGTKKMMLTKKIEIH